MWGGVLCGIIGLQWLLTVITGLQCLRRGRHKRARLAVNKMYPSPMLCMVHAQGSLLLLLLCVQVVRLNM